MRVVHSVLAGLLFALAAAAGIANAQPVQQDMTETEVAFDSHGVTLRGTVFTPASPGRHPAVVLIHGSGPGPRAEYLPEAQAFARAGVTTLVFDKRTIGYSTTHRDFSLLADDALAGVALLRTRTDVDPAAVGLWGFSEGGWVAPLAAARSPEVAFVVTIGGSGRTPLRTQTWSLRNRLAHQGITGSLPAAVAGPGAQFINGTGLFPEANFDPAPVLAQIHAPVLALWGEHDVKVPAAESAEIFQSELARAGNHSVTTCFVPGAGHNGHRTTDGFDSIGGAVFDGKPLGELGPGYADVITDWIHAVADGRPPASSAVPAPPETSLSRAPDGRPAYEYAALAFLLIGFAAYPLSAAARMLLRRSDTRRPSSVRWAARSVSALGLATVLGGVACVEWVLVTGAQRAPAVVLLGQPLQWLIVHILAATVLLAVAALALTWWRNRNRIDAISRAQLAILLLTGCVFVPWALHWQLLR
ncbi:prolyl oligopeptidase family serine peptidase [Nocardia sp. NPDC006630]|uniref:alpha/beta hydrolase family protein n=1 Tax=Nocardia sp. NPDC006630 TaxID=3157181 RepID=UPI0033A9DEEF